MKYFISPKNLILSIVLVILSCSSIFAYENNDSSKKACINLIPEVHNIERNTEFTTNVSLESVHEAVYSYNYYSHYNNSKNKIYAQDIKINYDKEYFEFVKAEIAQGQYGLDILHQDASKEGQLRFIIASKGEYYGINNDTQILKLTFKSKDILGLGRIEVANGLIANGEGAEFETRCSGGIVQIGKFNADVNHDGRYSLGDLAIDCRHYCMSYYNWDERYNVDVIRNNQVDEYDLKAIVETIVSNEN